jgi:hypothetical protein
MVDRNSPLGRAIKLGYELAETGRFQDFAAIERELVAFGFEDEARLIVGSVRQTIEQVCATGREREVLTWHSQTAC